MSHWSRLLQILSGAPVVTMCYTDAEGFPRQAPMHGMESKRLGRFVISMNKSPKEQSLRANPKATWYMHQQGHDAVLRGNVRILELNAENKEIFQEAWKDELKQYHHGWDDPQRVLAVLDVHDITLDGENIKVE